MLTIRDAQLQALAQGRVGVLRDELRALVEQDFAPVCAALGGRRVDALIDGCIAECRVFGAASRSEIVRAVRSLFQTDGLPALDDNAALRRVRAELQVRQLMSMLETLGGIGPP